ncbi:hypothetical protein R3P38DRAFT_2794160 [Favolaschia claudopus]|uniref:Uncharacterized protein n=1 Tax=Favolaschia claudopus TaxID=2862362 RepID=A0AAW0ABB1_9AGAR
MADIDFELLYPAECIVQPAGRQTPPPTIKQRVHKYFEVLGSPPPRCTAALTLNHICISPSAERHLSFDYTDHRPPTDEHCMNRLPATVLRAGRGADIDYTMYPRPPSDVLNKKASAERRNTQFKTSSFKFNEFAFTWSLNCALNLSKIKETDILVDLVNFDFIDIKFGWCTRNFIFEYPQHQSKLGPGKGLPASPQIDFSPPPGSQNPNISVYKHGPCALEEHLRLFPSLLLLHEFVGAAVKIVMRGSRTGKDGGRGVGAAGVESIWACKVGAVHGGVETTCFTSGTALGGLEYEADEGGRPVFVPLCGVGGHGGSKREFGLRKCKYWNAPITLKRAGFKLQDLLKRGLSKRRIEEVGCGMSWGQNAKSRVAVAGKEGEVVMGMGWIGGGEHRRWNTSLLDVDSFVSYGIAAAKASRHQSMPVLVRDDSPPTSFRCTWYTRRPAEVDAGWMLNQVNISALRMQKSSRAGCRQRRCELSSSSWVWMKAKSRVTNQSQISHKRPLIAGAFCRPPGTATMGVR